MCRRKQMKRHQSGSPQQLLLQQQKQQQQQHVQQKQQQQQQEKHKQPQKRPRAPPVAFGPFLAERQWATLREDLSGDGSCWEYCDFYRSHRDPYLAGEDGLMGIADEHCRLCFSWAFWNGSDHILKEKLFGVTGGGRPQGNHGEDVKEVYFYQLNSPDHSYMRMKYMYPSGRPFPYEELIRENSRRSQHDDEFEICDTDAFEHGFWELKAEYARLADGDTLCLLTAKNCSDSERTLHALPTVWFRNTWSTAYAEQLPGKSADQPLISRVANELCAVECRHPTLPGVFVHFGASGESAEPREVLFTRNEKGEKDAISRYLIGRPEDRPQLPENGGTKCSAVHLLTVKPGEEARVCVRLSDSHRLGRGAGHCGDAESDILAAVAKQRLAAESFYAVVLEWLPGVEVEVAEICQLAYSGLLWSKQYYEYRVAEFQRRRRGQGTTDGDANSSGAFKWNPLGWDHLDNADIMSMPDKWEFPWYASWDSSFHVAVLVDVDPEFAKGQMELLLSDRFISPEGQVPGCEFNYSDENPPVLAWAVHEIWQATGDTDFVRRVYPRLKLNFNWWLTHRRVESDKQEAEMADPPVYFKSGFLGMDNICAFDRSRVPEGSRLYQADAYAWVFSTALHCLQLALATGQQDSEVAFWLDWLGQLQRGFRHVDSAGDGFCYDILETRRQQGGGGGGGGGGCATDDHEVWERQFVRIRSMVGLLPLTALLGFSEHRLAAHRRAIERFGVRVEPAAAGGGSRFISLLDGTQWMTVFAHLFPAGTGGDADGEDEGFLGPHGVRMVSAWHRAHPVTLHVGGADWTLNYEPGESRTGMYGGNSNWRGSIWLCMNYLLAQAALRLHECRARPELRKFARLACERILGIFRQRDGGSGGGRPVHGVCRQFCPPSGPWSATEYVLFYEYFHGDTGRGCGASHQTGWTALVVKFAEMLHKRLTAV